jgi:flagellar FliL protein
MAEAAQEKIAVPAGVPMKMVIILLAGMLVLGLGGAFVMFKMMSGGHAGEDAKSETASDKGHGDSGKAGHGGAAPGAIAELDPFIVNLADSPEIRYLKVSIKLEVDGSETVEEIKNRTPQIRDSVLVLLTSKDSASIRTPQGKSQLRDEVTQRVNGILPRRAVKSAYFTDFVIQ